MSITGPIPLPQSPGDALFSGATSMQDIMSKILAGKQKQEELGQTALSNEQMNKYHMGELEQQKLANAQLNEYRNKQLSQGKELQPLKMALLEAKIKAMKEGKNGNADLTHPTSKTISDNQAIVASSNNIIPQIQSLIKMDVPGQLLNFSPNLQRQYESNANAVADGLMTTFNWPKTDQALEMAKQMAKKGHFETQSGYKKRLRGLIKEINSRRQNAQNILKNAKVQNMENNPEAEDEEVIPTYDSQGNLVNE